MNSNLTLNLPIISIAPWVEPPSPDNAKARLDVSAALHAACRDVGFFYLDISSFASKEQMEELMILARQFFALPQDEKDKISIRKQDKARGYQRLKENVTGGKADNHEAIDLYAPVANPDKSKPLWGVNQWPEQIQGFQAKFEAWVDKMKELGMIVMEAMAVGLGLSPEEWKEFQGSVDDSFWVMRIIGYPPLPNDYDGFSCGAHKDYGCLTFLYADDTLDALQVFMPYKGNQSSQPTLPINDTIPNLPREEGDAQGYWITADPKPGCVVCNIGEMWEIWTRGLYKSTLHRVIHRSSNYRVSIPFFFEPNFNAVVKPLPAVSRLSEEANLISEGEEKYEPVVYGQFLLKKVGSNFSDETPGQGRY